MASRLLFCCSLAIFLNVASLQTSTLIPTFGIYIDTSSILDRIRDALTNYDGAYGRPIYFRKSGQCLEMNEYLQPARCKVHRANQQWRLVGHQLATASSAHEGYLAGSTPCMDCARSQRNCYLVNWYCKNSQNQQFSFKIYTNQIDLTNNQIFFSIESLYHTGRCLTLYHHYSEQYFNLEECEGNVDQSFYLDIDFSDQINEIKSKIARKFNLISEKSETCENQVNTVTIAPIVEQIEHLSIEQNQIVTRKDVSTDVTKKCSGNLVPGIERMRRGIDITTLDLFPTKELLSHSNGFRKPLFEFSCNQERTWTHPLDLEKQYTVPDQISAVNSIPSGGLNAQTNFYTNLASYKRALANSVGIDVPFFGGFSASSTYRETQRQILKSDKFIVEVSAQVSAIHVDFQPNMIKPNQEFVEYVEQKLPLEYEQNVQMYDEFVNNFGTHYFESALFGGYLYQKTLIDNDFLYGSSEEDISASLKLSFLDKINSKIGARKTNSNYKDKFSAYAQSSFHYFGGDADLTNFDNDQGGIAISQWWNKVKKDPWLFSGKLKPIEQLIHNGTIRTQVRKAVLVHRAKAYLEDIRHAIDFANVKLNKLQTVNLIKTEQVLKMISTFKISKLIQIGRDMDRLFETVQNIRDETLLRDYSNKLNQLKPILFCKSSLYEICNDKLLSKIDGQLDEFNLLIAKMQNMIKMKSNQSLDHKLVSELIHEVRKFILYHTDTQVHICERNLNCDSCFDDKWDKIDFCKYGKAYSVVHK